MKPIKALKRQYPATSARLRTVENKGRTLVEVLQQQRTAVDIFMLETVAIVVPKGRTHGEVVRI